MKKYLGLLLWLVLMHIIIFGQSTIRSTKSIEQQFAWVKKQLEQPQKGKVLFAAHRGDWRNAPENSIQSLLFCIEKGVDIVECDLKKSKDGHLIVMHDKTIDRTTNGTGKPEQYTLQELLQFKLKNATGYATYHRIPTFENFLAVAKDRIVVCIDKGFEYFDEAMALVQKMGMTNQVIFNIPALTLDRLQALQLKGFSDGLFVNVLDFPRDTTQANLFFSSYSQRKRVVFHPTFAQDSIALIKWLPRVSANGMHVWLNSLWPEHNGGHHDDRAVELNQPDAAWGWLIQQGATIIQTDRPVELRSYLLKKKLHPKF